MKWQRFIALLAIIGSCLLSIVVFTMCAVDRLRSDKFNIEYRSKAVDYKGFGRYAKYDGGIFDLGSWACQLSRNAGLDHDDVLSRQCIDETAVFWMSLFVAISNSIMGILAWLDWRGQRLLVRSFKSARQEHERYYL